MIRSTALLLAVLALGVAADDSGYHALTWDKVPRSPAKGTWTHVSITGYAQWTRKEEDGDIHIRLCERRVDDPQGPGRCLVAEIIPAVPLPRPPAGKRAREIEVHGISRWDYAGGHGWFEIHPVLGWEEVGRE